MKKILAVFSLAVALTAMTGTATKKKVIFFGDSITQAGVEKGGYITVIDALLQKRGLAANYELIGAGIGGNKVYDLYLRLEDDVLSKKPDMVFIYIGVNDVWHKTLTHTGTDLDKFGRFYSALISKIKATGAKVILVTPAVIGEKKNGGNEQDKDLDIYSDAIRKLAADNGLPLVDLRKQFTAYDAAHNAANEKQGVLTTDGVHLNASGNNLVAELMLAEMLKP